MSMPETDNAVPQQVRIAILDDYQGVALDVADWSTLGDRADIHVFRHHLGSGAALIEALQPFDVIVAMRERTAFPAPVLDALPNLRLLASTGMRNSSIDLDAAHRNGVVVCGSQGSNKSAGATAEVAWALILAILKRLPEQQAALRAGHWQTDLTESIEGKVLGVVGLGKLGARVARIGAAFGMDVIAWSSNLSDERAAKVGARRVDKQELFATADVISLHLVLGARSAGVVGRAELQSMKRTACLINTSRDGLVEEGALLEALEQGWIGAAGLDVFPVEPMPADHPLCKFGNVVMTPHLGYVTPLNLAAFYGGTIANIRAWMDGQPVLLLER